jgi:hypothetical protein
VSADQDGAISADFGSNVADFKSLMCNLDDALYSTREHQVRVLDFNQLAASKGITYSRAPTPKSAGWIFPTADPP